MGASTDLKLWFQHEWVNWNLEPTMIPPKNGNRVHNCSYRRLVSAEHSMIPGMLGSASGSVQLQGRYGYITRCRGLSGLLHSEGVGSWWQLVFLCTWKQWWDTRKSSQLVWLRSWWSTLCFLRLYPSFDVFDGQIQFFKRYITSNVGMFNGYFFS